YLRGGRPRLRMLLFETQQCQHPARLSLFRPIRIVMFQIASRADTAVMDVVDTGIPALPDDFRSKINFVMRRSNAWAQLRNQLTRLNPKNLSHPLDRLSGDS